MANARTFAAVSVAVLLMGNLIVLLRKQSILSGWRFRMNYGPYSGEIKSRSKGFGYQPFGETEIFIGVNLGKKSELARSIVETWGSIMKTQVTVVFFACSTFNDSLPFTFKNESYPCYEYPPMESWRIALKTMSQYEHVKWFFKCDDDSYVNVRALVAFLHNITLHGARHDDRLYFGSAGYGREMEKHHLGIANASFAVGGPCVGLSAGAMRALRPILDDCMRWPAVRLHSDTQLSRCLLSLNITLRLPHHTDRSLRRVFRHVPGHEVLRLDGSVTSPFAASTVPAALAFEDLDPPPVTLHSVKDPVLMHRLHAQLYHGAIPLSAGRPHLRAFPCVHNPAVAEAATVCPISWRGLGSNNASALTLAVDRCSISLPECPSPSTALPAAPSTPRLADAIASAFLLCLRPRECGRGPLFRSVMALGVPVETVAVAAGPGAAASRGARSLAKALRRARIRALGKAAGNRRGAVLVLEESAVLSRGFAQELRSLLSQPRCGCPLAVGSSVCTPGIVLLDAAPRSTAVSVRYLREAERQSAHSDSLVSHQLGALTGEDKATKHTASQCVNALPETDGGAAVLMASGALPLALALLAADPSQSLGSFFLELSLAGLPVRAVWPTLAMVNSTAVRAGVAYSSHSFDQV